MLSSKGLRRRKQVVQFIGRQSGIENRVRHNQCFVEGFPSPEFCAGPRELTGNEFGPPIDSAIATDKVVQSSMMLADMLGGWEIVLILTIVLILFGAKSLPGFGERLQRGRDERRKALREAIERAISDRPSSETEKVPTGRFLMWVAITLGVVCLVLEFSQFSR